ncbi:AcrR family transcriptional regulator [Alkalihalobacillus xiaoxiensis]|uniref:AcrR family transcriptional regulator n=1 Tax=Shouchella xiaoxiensis TaxID=766895 RepID=A0ABS2SWB5_9BACI|nr:TetR/AcrR family transcriptional regulator [Shouchella xiaoxiensis]MBM7839838.1 AcrR family transcriptional regulator [Shouchella xiaoxiensis]
MPKIVDHEERRKHIAAVTWKVISEQGLRHATSRTIAKEAGLSQGALRHYFSNQESLLQFAIELVKEQLIERIKRLKEKKLEPVEQMNEYLLEFIPTNEQTLLEMEVWFAFVTLAKTEKNLNPDLVGLQTAIKDVIVFLQNEGVLKEIDVELEQEKLYALMNGMALNLYLEPAKINREKSKELIRNYLESILTQKR